jgi:signal transduction histidine kinase
VARHGGPGVSATVRVAFRPRELVVEGDDDGRGSDGAPAPGHGLTGMRERVDALGGSLRAGPRDAGGFSVRVTLPLPGTRPGVEAPAGRTETAGLP